MKKLFLLLLLLSLGNGCFAFDIVYPKRKDVTVNAKSTFFIGSTSEPIKINGQDVPTNQAGAFAYVVNLNDGQNTFTVESQYDRQIYVITKPVIKSGCSTPAQFIQYQEMKKVSVTTDGAPLRSTPIDAGINRMAHLQRDIILQTDGEKSGFYRVVLGKDKYGWISKSNVKMCDDNTFEHAEVKGYDYEDSKEYFTFIFHLTRPVPFEIIEGDPLLIKFFNIKDDYEMDFPTKEALGGRNLAGYSGRYEGNDFILKIRKPPVIKRKLHGLTVTVDAGHGGYEVGSTSCLKDLEKDINLAIAKELELELKKRGAKVVMTRDDDTYVGLKDRVEKANEHDSTVFLSIHGNALPDGLDPNKSSGTSIYYYYEQAKPLAQELINTMTAELGINNDKVRQGSLAVVRNTNALSLLIEVAYMINPDDSVMLSDKEFQKNCAKAIADGLEKYFFEN